jgi:PIN domain nuclease of toxin-antitoxin system
MIALLDTHVLAWWLFDDPRLGSAARDVMADPTNVVFVSAASVWEIAIKKSLGKIAAPDDLVARVEEAIFEPLPVGLDHAQHVATLPLHHRDPFDRLLVAQAQVEGATLVTVDDALAAYDVKRLDAGAARP